MNLSPEHDSHKTTLVQGLDDSSPQSNVWSLREYFAAGLSIDDLSRVVAASKSTICIDGAFFVTLSGETADGLVMTCKTMVYVSRDVNGFYLSYSTMLQDPHQDVHWLEHRCLIMKRFWLFQAMASRQTPSDQLMLSVQHVLHEMTSPVGRKNMRSLSYYFRALLKT